jgi:hypothetical protein
MRLQGGDRCSVALFKTVHQRAVVTVFAAAATGTKRGVAGGAVRESFGSLNGYAFSPYPNILKRPRPSPKQGRPKPTGDAKETRRLPVLVMDARVDVAVKAMPQPLPNQAARPTTTTIFP